MAEVRAPDYWVYRALDVAGTLMYVGFSGKGIQRFKQHRRESKWAYLVDRFEVEHFDDPEEALARERELIHRQNPAYNLVHVNRFQRRIIPTPKGMWTAKEAGEWLQFSPIAVTAMAKRGDLPGERHESIWFFDPEVLDTWMKEHQHVP